MVIYLYILRMSGGTVEVLCPAGVQEGDPIAVTADGIRYEVLLPANVCEGEAFTVCLGIPPNDPNENVTPAQLAGMQAMVRSMATGFLQAALHQILQAIDRAWVIQEYVDANANAFVDYRPGSGEHLLEWTSIHHDYCALVEQAIQSALTELSCDASTVLEYAQTYGGDPRADKLLSRLLAFSDYGHFCAMMRSASEQGPIAC